MASYIARRKFLATLGGAAVAWPPAASAQQRDGVRRIGALIGVAGDAETKGSVAAFRKRLERGSPTNHSQAPPVSRVEVRRTLSVK